MKLNEVLAQITPLPWRFREMDNDMIIPSVRMFGRQKHDPSKEICFGRIDVVRDARYVCHAANALPEAVRALRLLLKDQKRSESGLSRSQFKFCESVLAKAEIIQSEQPDLIIAVRPANQLNERRIPWVSPSITH